jgi:hypothetical protein
MKKHSQTLDEVEVTVWILMAILWLAVLLFGYLFWKHVSVENPHASQPPALVNVAVCREPRVTIWRLPGVAGASAVAVPGCFAMQRVA